MFSTAVTNWHIVYNFLFASYENPNTSCRSVNYAEGVRTVDIRTNALKESSNNYKNDLEET